MASEEPSERGPSSRRLLLTWQEVERLRLWILSTFARAERVGDAQLVDQVLATTTSSWATAADLLRHFRRYPPGARVERRDRVRIGYRAARAPRVCRRPSRATRRTRAVDIPGVLR